MFDRLDVVLDLQSVLLLRSTAQGRWCARREGQWFWLESRNAPARWNALRRAVFARKSESNTNKNPVSGQARGA